MNIVDAITFHAKTQPNTIALLPCREVDEEVSYRRLANFIENFMSHPELSQVAPGTIVALSFHNPVLHIVALLALMKKGAVTLSTHGEKIPVSLKTELVLTDRSSTSAQVQMTRVDRQWLLESRTAGVSPAVQLPDDEYCRLFSTSGTTGQPKIVVLSRGQVAKRLVQRETLFGRKYSECSRIFIGLSVSTVPGYTAALHGLMGGRSILFETVDPSATIEAIVKNDVQVLLASPASLAAFYEMYKKRYPGIKKFEFIVPFGGSLSSRLVRAFKSEMCQNLLTLYGSTELASIAFADTESTKQIAGAVGYIVPDVEIDILDDQGRKRPNGESGRISIRSLYAAAGYMSESLEDLERFPETGVVPGDLGYVTEDGMLVLSGREDNLIDLGGSKVSVERIESAISSFEHVKEAAVMSLQGRVGFEQLVGVVVWSETQNIEALRRGMRPYLEGVLAPREIPRLFIETSEIPKNHMGKIDRDALRRVTVEILMKTKQPN